MVEREPAGDEINIELRQTVLRCCLQEFVDSEHQLILLVYRCFIRPEKGFQFSDLLVLIIDVISVVRVAITQKLVILWPVHPARHRALQDERSLDHIRAGICPTGLPEPRSNVQRPRPHVIGNKVVELMRAGHGVDLAELLHPVAGPLQPDLVIARFHGPVLHDELRGFPVIDDDGDRAGLFIPGKLSRDLPDRLPEIFLPVSRKGHLRAPAVPKHDHFRLFIHIVIHFYLLFLVITPCRLVSLRI